MESRMREIRTYGLTRGSRIGGNAEAWVSTLRGKKSAMWKFASAVRKKDCIRYSCNLRGGVIDVVCCGQDDQRGLCADRR